MLTIFKTLSKTIRSKTLLLSLAVAFILSQTFYSYAQETGQISGIVTDSTGAVVPGVSVSARNAGTNAVRTTTTSNTGSYLFTGLTATVYEVSIASSSGFGAFKAKAEITVGGVLTLEGSIVAGPEGPEALVLRRALDAALPQAGDSAGQNR